MPIPLSKSATYITLQKKTTIIQIELNKFGVHTIVA